MENWLLWTPLAIYSLNQQNCFIDLFTMMMKFSTYKQATSMHKLAYENNL